MKVHIPTNFLHFFSLWKESLGFGTSQTDRQTGKKHLQRQTDSQHECEPEIKYRFNIPRGLSARPAGADLPTFCTLQGAGQRPGRFGPSGLVQSRLGKRLRYLLLGSPRPQRGRAAASRRGREARATAAAAARPPSLPPSVSPSLPLSLSPSLALCRSRGPPAGNLFWTKSRYLRKREKRKDFLCGKEGKTLNCFYFSCSDPGSALIPTSWPQLCGCRGVRGLLSCPRGPPCPAHCVLHTLWAAAPGSPNTTQTPRSFLLTLHPVARLAAGLRREPARLRLRPKSTCNPPCPCSRARPRHPSQPRRLQDHIRAAVLPPATDLLPCPGPTQSPGPDAPTRSPQSPLPPLPFTCSQEGLHLRAEASPWAQAEGAEEPRSQGSYRGSARLS